MGPWTPPPSTPSFPLSPLLSRPVNGISNSLSMYNNQLPNYGKSTYGLLTNCYSLYHRWHFCCQLKLSASALPQSGTHCHITVVPLNCSVLSSVTQKPNFLTLLIAIVNTRPSFRHHAPLIRSRHMAL